MCRFVNNGQHSRIDKCMKQEIKDLNFWLRNTNSKLPKFKVVACCCGHDKYSKTILVKNTKSNLVLDWFTSIQVPRTRNFYKRDKQGVYYIPEVENAKG